MSLEMPPEDTTSRLSIVDIPAAMIPAIIRDAKTGDTPF